MQHGYGEPRYLFALIPGPVPGSVSYSKQTPGTESGDYRFFVCLRLLEAWAGRLKEFTSLPKDYLNSNNTQTALWSDSCLSISTIPPSNTFHDAASYITWSITLPLPSSSGFNAL